MYKGPKGEKRPPRADRQCHRGHADCDGTRPSDGACDQQEESYGRRFGEARRREGRESSGFFAFFSATSEDRKEGDEGSLGEVGGAKFRLPATISSWAVLAI